MCAKALRQNHPDRQLRSWEKATVTDKVGLEREPSWTIRAYCNGKLWKSSGGEKSHVICLGNSGCFVENELEVDRRTEERPLQ